MELVREVESRLVALEREAWERDRWWVLGGSALASATSDLEGTVGINVRATGWVRATSLGGGCPSSVSQILSGLALRNILDSNKAACCDCLSVAATSLMAAFRGK
jgi:hypothetical protein